MKGMTLATKGFGLALKAAGIGVILSALVKLGQVFQGNIEIARKFEKIGIQIGAMFDVLRDTIEPVADFLVNMWENPLEGLKELGMMIVNNILNRFKAVMTLGKGVAKVLQGVFTLDFDKVTEGVTGMAQASVQFSTGLDPETQWAFVDGVKAMGEEMEKESKIAGKLAEDLQKVRDEEMAMLTVRAEANKVIAKSRLLAEDETLSMEERLVALKAAVAEEQRVAAIEMQIQKDKVDAMQAMIDLGKSSEEDMRELAQERARLTELETASILKQKRVVTEIVTFEKQIETERKKIAKAEEDRQKLLLQARELNLVFSEELADKEIQALIKAEEKRLGVIEASAQKEKELKEKQIDEVKKMELESAINIMESLAQIGQQKLTNEKNALQEQLDAGLISQEEFDKESAKIEKESVRREKKNAMLNILINTAQGIAAAIKAGAGLVFPANLGAIAAGVATVVAGIANAKAVLSKVPGDGGGGGVDTGSTGEAETPALTQAGIGGNLIPNFNTEQNGQPLQAYVVENDISDAQALQEELELQATL